jgi:ABC-2 type transport system ATP-binding protein
VPETTPAIDVQHLGHAYAQRRALADVTFTVNSGEIVGLLGPNGGGKTTLFRILATLLRPSEGDARILGRSVIADPDGVRRALGVVFQRPSLDLKLTVRENLTHHGHLYGLSGGELKRRCDAMMAALGIADRAGDRVESLSGGLQRRAELAKGLLHRPSVLLLDEPNTGLDPNARREFLNHLETRRQNDGVTILLTTHFMEEAERCDRVGILHEGKLVAFDKPTRLKSSIGGDVVVIECREPDSMAAQIRKNFSIDATVVNGSLRIETPGGHRFVSQVVETFRDEITSVTWGQPTLDDVFVHLTGRRLAEAAA